MTTKSSRLIRILFALCLLVPVPRGLPAEAAPLRIGVSPVFPPMIYKEAGKIVGIEVDFAKALGEELGRPIKFVEVDWEDQIPDLIAGKTDVIMSSMSVTPARALRVAFSKPYLGVGQMMLVRREDSVTYVPGFPPVPPRAIGVVKSTTGDYLVQQEFPRSKRVTFKTAQDAAKALQKKKIDVFISDAPVVVWLAGMNEVEGLVPVRTFLSQEQLAWPVRRSDSDLEQAINNALEKLQKDGRATAIIKHWLPMYQ